MPLVITIPFSPILWQLGPLTIRWYGLGYAVAFLVGLWLAGRHLRRHRITERDYGDMAFWTIVVGLIAARLYYVVQNDLGWYLTHPQHILALWEGGMAYFGAVFVVPIFLFAYTRWRQMPFWIIADAAALFAGIGQPIGRIGNIFNGDIVGYPSDLPWAIRYTNPQTFAPEIGVSYQPAAAYELLLGLVILAILLAVRRRLRVRPGGLFLLYLGLYALSQFFIFFLRDNSVTAFGLKQAQLSAIVLGLITLALVPIWRLTTRPQGAAAAPAEADAGGATGSGAQASETENQPVKTGWLPTRLEDQPVKAEDQPVKAEDQPDKVEAQPVKAEDKPDKVEAQPVKADDKPVKAEDKPDKAEDKPVKAEDKPVKAEDEPVGKAEDKPAKAEDKPARAKNQPAKAGDRSVKAEVQPGKAEDQPAARSRRRAKNRGESKTNSSD